MIDVFFSIMFAIMGMFMFVIGKIVYKEIKDEYGCDLAITMVAVF